MKTTNEYSGDLKGFLTFVGPKMTNIIANAYRSKKKGKACQASKIKMDRCYTRTLEASHFEVTRPQIIENILQDYRQEKDFYVVDLKDFEHRFKEYHKQPNVVFFLCKSCHDIYEKTLKNKITVISEKEKEALHQSKNRHLSYSNKGKNGWAFNIPISKISKPYTLVLKENEKTIEILDINFKDSKFSKLTIREDRNSLVIMLDKINGNFIDKSSSVDFSI